MPPLPPPSELIALARQAGDAILQVYQHEFHVEQKADHSPLTEADLASHRVICEGLARLTPEIPILSEESAQIPFATRRQWQRYWLVDPLDGTKEFVKRNGEFTVNIALIDHHQPLLGVVHVPVSDTTYHGHSGSGAWCIQQGENRAIQVAPQRQQPLRVVGSRSHAGVELQRFLDHVGDHQLLSMGSSLKLCLVAAGEADIYPRLGPTSEWDTAAAHAIVLAAGGEVTNLQLQPLRYNTKDSLLNPHFLVFGDRQVDWRNYLRE